MTDKDYLDRALDFIVSGIPEENICEELLDIPEEAEFCSEKCENLNQFCVLRFLEHYKKEEEP